MTSNRVSKEPRAERVGQRKRPETGARLWPSTNEPHGAVFRFTGPVAAAERHA